jgi:hypothetical protein
VLKYKRGAPPKGGTRLMNSKTLERRNPRKLLNVSLYLV